MTKNRKSNYGDGVMFLYRKKTERNIRSMDDLEYAGKLAFEEKTIRQEDVEFAMQNDKQLTMKVATPDYGQMDTNMNTRIGDTVYGIIHIDRDKKKQELYFYLTEVRRVDR